MSKNKQFIYLAVVQFISNVELKKIFSSILQFEMLVLVSRSILSNLDNVLVSGGAVWTATLQEVEATVFVCGATQRPCLPPKMHFSALIVRTFSVVDE